MSVVKIGGFSRTKNLSTFRLGILAVVVGLLCVSPSVYGRLVWGVIESQISQERIILKELNPELSWGSLSLEALDIYRGDTLDPIRISSLSITPSLLSLFTLSPKISVRGRCLNGDVDLSISPFSKVISGKLSDLELSELPQLANLGIGGGRGDLTFSELSAETRDALPLFGDIEIRFSDLSVPHATKLPPHLTGGFEVTIPEIPSLTLSLRAKRREDLLAIESLSITGSLMEIQGNGSLEPSSPYQMKASLTGRLSRSGAKELGTILGLLTRTKREVLEEGFALTIEGPVRQPQLTVKPHTLDPQQTGLPSEEPSV